MARSYLAVEIRHEVNSGSDAVHVHEKILLPERLGEPIVQPTGRADRIVSAVIDENLIGHRLPGLPEKIPNLIAGPLRSL
jgi:hypothetical protein